MPKKISFCGKSCQPSTIISTLEHIVLKKKSTYYYLHTLLSSTLLLLIVYYKKKQRKTTKKKCILLLKFDFFLLFNKIDLKSLEDLLYCFQSKIGFLARWD
jgi:hypothetical protein